MSIPNLVTAILMPALDISHEEMTNIGFIMAYADDADYEHTEKCQKLFLFTKPHSQFEVGKFIEKREADIIETYDYPGGYTMIVFRFPERFKEDYKLYQKSKYSKISQELKNKIKRVEIAFPKHFQYTEEDKIIEEINYNRGYHIVNKTELIKNYWSELFNVHFEDDWEVGPLARKSGWTFNYNKISKELIEN